MHVQCRGNHKPSRQPYNCGDLPQKDKTGGACSKHRWRQMRAQNYKSNIPLRSIEVKILRNVMLLLVLYRCDTWLRNLFAVMGNSWKISELHRQEVTDEWRKIRNEALLRTYSMVQSPSWEANWFAASQEIPRISRNPKVHYRTHKRPPPVSILGQPNPVHIPTSHLLEIHPNIIHPSKPRSPQWSPSLRFPQKDPSALWQRNEGLIEWVAYVTDMRSDKNTKSWLAYLSKQPIWEPKAKKIILKCSL